MPSAAGLQHIATGAILFGTSYGFRLYQGLIHQGRWTVLFDSAMVCAALLLWTGLHRFGGRSARSIGAIACLVLTFAGVRQVCETMIGKTAPFAILTITLAVIYTGIARTAHQDARVASPILKGPLQGLRALMVFLATLTLWRGWFTLNHGPSVLYQGGFAQLYYAGATLTAVLIGPTLLWIAFGKLNQELADAASHDSLTGTLNRNGVDELLRRHFGSRKATSMTFLQIDIDHFKRVNDQYGHGTGDHALRAVSNLLLTHVRACDFVARTGGEEFLIGLAEDDPAAAVTLADRLCRACRDARLVQVTPDVVVTCTVSIGISLPFSQLSGREVAEQQADAALYAAKAAGRDRVERADHLLRLNTNSSEEPQRV